MESDRDSDGFSRGGMAVTPEQHQQAHRGSMAVTPEQHQLSYSATPAGAPRGHLVNTGINISAVIPSGHTVWTLFYHFENPLAKRY